MQGTNGLSKANKIFSIVTGIIIVIGFLWYFIVDRFTVVNKVEMNEKNINSLSKVVEEHLTDSSEDNEAIRNIEYNLKRLLEKGGMEWRTLESK